MLQRAGTKLSEIAGSDLSTGSKLLYAAHLYATHLYAAHLAASRHRRSGMRRYRLEGGGWIELREGTTDRKVFEEIFLSRTYAPFVALSRPDKSEPCVLVDLGANVGFSAVWLARALHAGRVVAVEPDPKNYAMLLRNLRLAGIAERSEPVQAFAGAERGFAVLEDSGNGAWGMRMGVSAAAGIPVLPVAEIAARATAGFPRRPRVIVKCDIEGAERHLFERLHDWEHLADFIMLELHMELFPEGEFRGCLECSRYDWKLHGTISRDGVLAVIGLERMEQKSTRVAGLAGELESSLRAAAGPVRF